MSSVKSEQFELQNSLYFVSSFSGQRRDWTLRRYASLVSSGWSSRSRKRRRKKEIIEGEEEMKWKHAQGNLQLYFFQLTSPFMIVWSRLRNVTGAAAGNDFLLLLLLFPLNLFDPHNWMKGKRETHFLLPQSFLFPLTMSYLYAAACSQLSSPNRGG